MDEGNVKAWEKMSSKLVVKQFGDKHFKISYENIELEVNPNYNHFIHELNLSGRMYEMMIQDYPNKDLKLTPKFHRLKRNQQLYIPLYQEYDDLFKNSINGFEYSNFLFTAISTFFTDGNVDSSFNKYPIMQAIQVKKSPSGYVKEEKFLDLIDVYRHLSYNSFDIIQTSLEDKCTHLNKKEISDIIDSAKRNLYPKKVQSINPQPWLESKNRLEKEKQNMREWFKRGFKDDYFKK
jgi:hypothetical protein